MANLLKTIGDIFSKGVTRGITSGISRSISNAITKGVSSASKKAVSAVKNAKKDDDEEEVRTQKKSSSRKAAEPKAEPAAATMEMPLDVQTEWYEKLPGFPMWEFGGTSFEFNENGTSSDGNTYWHFIARGATPEGLEAYVQLLLKSGFVSAHFDNSTETLVKNVGGKYLVFNQTEAFGSDAMEIAMFRTGDTNEFR